MNTYTYTYTYTTATATAAATVAATVAAAATAAAATAAATAATTATTATITMTANRNRDHDHEHDHDDNSQPASNSQPATASQQQPASNSQQQPATASNSQQQPATASNDKQRQATTSNDKQRQAATSSNKQQQATASSSKQQQAAAPSNEQQAASNNQQATINKQQTTSNCGSRPTSLQLYIFRQCFGQPRPATKKSPIGGGGAIGRTLVYWCVWGPAGLLASHQSSAQPAQSDEVNATWATLGTGRRPWLVISAHATLHVPAGTAGHSNAAKPSPSGRPFLSHRRLKPTLRIATRKAAQTKYDLLSGVVETALRELEAAKLAERLDLAFEEGKFAAEVAKATVDAAEAEAHGARATISAACPAAVPEDVIELQRMATVTRDPCGGRTMLD